MEKVDKEVLNFSMVLTILLVVIMLGCWIFTLLK